MFVKVAEKLIAENLYTEVFINEVKVFKADALARKSIIMQNISDLNCLISETVSFKNVDSFYVTYFEK